MGREAEDVLALLRRCDAEKLDYNTVMQVFIKNLLPQMNVLYEWAKFNSRKQDAHETADMFITELIRIAEASEYSALKEELICDRLMVGPTDTQVSEKLQHNAELTLEAAVNTAHNMVTIKQQQKDLRPQLQ